MAQEPEALTQATDITGRGADIVDMKLEVVVLPVADVDRARDFYKALGWREDADFAGLSRRSPRVCRAGDPDADWVRPGPGAGPGVR